MTYNVYWCHAPNIYIDFSLKRAWTCVRQSLLRHDREMNERTNAKVCVCVWVALIRFKVNVHLSWSKGLLFFGDSVDGLKLYRNEPWLFTITFHKKRILIILYMTTTLYCIATHCTEWVKLEFLQLKVIWERNSLE